MRRPELTEDNFQKNICDDIEKNVAVGMGSIKLTNFLFLLGFYKVSGLNCKARATNSNFDAR